MSEFGGLWKQPNNPACTKRVKVTKRVSLRNSHYCENSDTFSESWALYEGKESVVMTLYFIYFVFFLFFIFFQTCS